jgi:small GTP-binding protein
VKVILVGNSGVGKSTIFNRIFGDEQCPERPTVAPGFARYDGYTKDGVKVNLDFWDTAGQEVYRALTVSYFHGANIALCCRHSDEEDMQQSIEWINRVRQTENSCFLVSVRTKTDEMSPADETLYRQVEARLNQQYKFRASFETSAKTGKGVDDLMQAVIEMAASILEQNHGRSGIELSRNSPRKGKNCGCI